LMEQPLHAKNVTVDGRQFLIGTFDFNRLSARYSLEVAVAGKVEVIASTLKSEFERNMERSREVTAGNRRRNPFSKLLRRVSLKIFQQGDNRKVMPRPDQPV
jgi:phosphatidylserine/phosphatidylglycerophosphate/cardiolipin synthase-like enzyme